MSTTAEATPVTTTPEATSAAATTAETTDSAATTSDAATTPATSAASSSSAPPPASTESTTIAQDSTTAVDQSTAQSSQPPDTAEASTVISTSVVTPSEGLTSTIVATLTTTPASSTHALLSTTSANPAATSSFHNIHSDGNSSNGDLDSGGKIAIAVVVPVAFVALTVLGIVFFFRRRRLRRDAEEERRKEVEDYAYNPNNGPSTRGNVASAAVIGTASTVTSTDGHGSHKLVDDDEKMGYRGWGSTGRKAPNMTATSPGAGSGGGALDLTSRTPPVAPVEYHPYYPGSHSPPGEKMRKASLPAGEDEAVAFSTSHAPRSRAASTSRSHVQRGPSNASSRYSHAAASDTSAADLARRESHGAYYSAYAAGPYADTRPQSYYPVVAMPAPGGAPPVIQDVGAQRSARIENASFAQNVGIARNF